MSKIFSVTITKSGKNPAQWYREVKASIYPELQNQIKISADATAEIMQEIIKGAGYKLDKLANAINVMVLNSTGGVDIGIGLVDGFPKSFKGEHYWYYFDQGCEITQPNIGYFGDNFRAPEADGSGEKWHHTGKGSGFFLMTPHKVISPLNFVDKGYDALTKHIEKEIDKFSKNLENNAK